MENKPLVSVIMATHNRGPLLATSMRSVLAQTYQNLELIVVDDASTDDTPDVARSVDDSRVRYLRLPENRRPAGARNAGIAQARGELIAFNDDDDLWFVTKLERQVQHLVGGPADVGLSLGGYIRYWGGKSFSDYVGGPFYFGSLDFSHGFIGEFSLIATPGWLLRKEVLDRAGGFDERMRIWEDWELAARLWRQCKFSHLNEPVFLQDRARPAGGGSWDDLSSYANGYRIIVEKHAQYWNGRARAHHRYKLARIALREAPDAPATRALLQQTVKDNPMHLKALGWLMVSTLGPSATRWAVNAFNSGAGKR